MIAPAGRPPRDGGRMTGSRPASPPSDRPMTAPPRSSSLGRQLVLPAVGLLLAGVLATVAFASWLAARRAADAALERQTQIVDTLADARVPLTLPVLETLARLTGSAFVVWNPRDGGLGPATLPEADRAALAAAGIGAAVERGDVLLGGRRWRVATVRSGGVRPETVVVLTPRRTLLALVLESSWPQLAVAAATLALLVPAMLAATGRLARRIGGVEQRVAAIAEGDFHPRPPGGTDDEIGRLGDGVERMCRQLGVLRARLVAGERERLLGQLAAGFAHELRNALTGARLAIDLHRSRCPGSPDDGSLDVARRQLAVIEEEVRGLLALSRRTESAPAPVPLAELLAEVADLVSPRSQHAGTALVVEPAGATVIVVRRDALRAALVNLACNALEAAGPGGHVRLAAVCGPDGVRLRVEDDGPGPPEHLAATIHEPFVTGKPEGIGLGLAIVKAVAEEHGGRLEWHHADGRTRFEILLPAAVAALPPAPSAAVPLP